MQELKQNEMNEITGGEALLTGLVVGLAVITAAYLEDHWSEFKSGVVSGVRSTIGR
jgi:hypothetical protein